MTPPDSNDPGQGVLRRMLQNRDRAKLGQGGAPQLPQPPAPTPARAAATAIGRSADRLYRLPIVPISVEVGAMTLAELPELLPELPLICVLQGPGEQMGSIAFCPQAVASLIEWQALGRVTSRSLDRRRPTRSDALLCADFVNALMVDLPVEMAGVEGFEAIAGYRFATHLDDPRPLSLMLEDKPYRTLTFNLRIGGGDTRDGRVLLALPQSAAASRATGISAQHAAAEPAKVAPKPAPPAPRPSLQGAMRDAPIQLHGVLCRRRVTLSELRALTQGRLLSLPRSCLTQATLETADGQVLAEGKLGEAEGCHAIRLRDLSVPEAVEPAAPSMAAEKEVALRAAHAPGDLAQPDAFRAPARPAARPGTALDAANG